MNALLLGVAALYLWCPVHRFPPARPFHGRRWYNPYAGIAPSTTWRKVNLHAHSRAWRGLTNGRGSAEAVLARYSAMGYDAAPVSNYQEISRASDGGAAALTVYEQGFNLWKVHFLAVAPRWVDWLDYPLLQGKDEEQHRIDRLRESAGLVVMAHPRLRHAFTNEDLQALTGYAAMEIGSHESRGTGAWDVALDAGRPVWAVADDDTHDGAPNEAGRYWSMIAAPSANADALTAALATGRLYAVFGHRGRADVALDAMMLSGDTLSVQLRGVPAEIQLIGPGGVEIDAKSSATSAHWVLPCDAAWVRVVARTPTTQLFLEPIVRSENGALPSLTATVAIVPTLIRRALAMALLLFAIGPVVERARRAQVEFPRVRASLREAA